jgi:hypothetical protein
MDSFVFARHTPDCKFKRDRLYRRCNCPKWGEGRFNLSGSDSPPLAA